MSQIRTWARLVSYSYYLDSKHYVTELMNQIFAFTHFNLCQVQEQLLCHPLISVYITFKYHCSISNQTIKSNLFMFFYTKPIDTDYLDLIFLAVLATIIAASLLCTYLDRRYNEEGTLHYYKEAVKDKSIKFSAYLNVAYLKLITFF